jgi:adenine-specific DNA-methyltransferase
MSKKFEKMKSLLEELFQLDQPELDFGFYRVMHAKSAEVSQFLDKDLLPQVNAALSHYQSADKAVMTKELEDLIAGVKDAGMNPDDSPKVQELQKQIEEDSVDLSALESDVYNHLYRFFRRYYHEGDFISKRVYKEGVYAIPYEGEEVKLHWANHDQYYIKTSEYLRDYAFRLHPGSEDNPMRVHFRLVDAAEGEHGNVKESQKRLFILANNDAVSEEDGELILRFEYRPVTLTDWPEEQRDGKKKPPEQKHLLGFADQAILSELDGTSDWSRNLGATYIKSNNEKADYNKLRAHLNRYAARNTFDYFIHKDLGGFLRRELDFYIKNEVMHLDDIENETAPKVEQVLSKIKVIRKIASKIIDFLAQLENFQKKLWLKKKFVVEANYCLTLDRVPENLYPTICENSVQREEWVSLFSIDEITGTAGSLLGSGNPAYSEPLTAEFLIANDKLVLDTNLFEDDFKAKLLESIEDLDEQCDGILVHSENFQALQLLQRRYQKKVECVYIDPPYNAPNSEIAYKNNFKHSSFLSLIHGRLSLSSTFVGLEGSHVIAIDKHEENGVFRLVDEMFTDNDNVAVTVEHNRKGVQDNHFSFTNEYAIFSVAQARGALNRLERQRQDWDWSNFRNWGGESLRTDAANCFYSVVVCNGEIVGFGDVWFDENKSPSSANVSASNRRTEIFPIDKNGVERKWRYERGTVEGIVGRLRVVEGSDGVLSIEIAKTSDQFKTVWYSPKYNAGDNGTRLVRGMGVPIDEFSYPKSIFTVQDCIFSVTTSESQILDYFAGSGTTGHAVINLNRADGGNRKYILVEMGGYFETVLKPRIAKVAYSDTWKGGKPVNRNTGVSHCFKYIRLESYEDSLNNLALQQSDTQKQLLLSSSASGEGSLREKYLLNYMLNVESRESQSLLNVSAFTDPTEYKLKVKNAGSDESYEANADLVETFNYLIGLTVKHIAAPRIVTAAFKRDDDPDLPAGAPQRLILANRMKQDSAGKWWFRTVSGTMPDGLRTLVIWRNRPGGEDEEGMEQDNLVLNSWFERQGYSSKDSEYDQIFINGDNNVENLRASDDTWKVRLIEDEFHTLMFAEEAV